MRLRAIMSVFSQKKQHFKICTSLSFDYSILIPRNDKYLREVDMFVSYLKLMRCFIFSSMLLVFYMTDACAGQHYETLKQVVQQHQGAVVTMNMDSVAPHKESEEREQQKAALLKAELGLYL